MNSISSRKPIAMEDIRDHSILISSLWHMMFVVLGILVFATITGLWNVVGPKVFWDEGWTLSVARTWVEQGHYGLLHGGKLAPGGLQASFPVTASVALSFELFGVGVWQGRLPMMLFTLGAFGIMFDLASRLFNRRVAYATMLLLTLAPMHPEFHALFIGRQVLAEMPMLFLLLLGYSLLPFMLQRSAWLLPALWLAWGVALISKAQVMPFWAVSLLLPACVALFTRRQHKALLLGAALVGSYGASRLLLMAQAAFLHTRSIPPDPIHGLYDVTAFVPDMANRLFALRIVCLFAIPVVLGYGYGLWQYLRRPVASTSGDAGLVTFAVFAFGASWLAWYLLLSVGWMRYLFPAVFIGSLFLAALVHDLTDGFELRRLGRKDGQGQRTRWRTQRGIRFILAGVLMIFSLEFGRQTLLVGNRYGADSSIHDVAAFLNTQTTPDARIETYESGLFLLLDRPYSYPPDQIHVELNRRAFRNQDVPIKYDPLATDPDYLITGPQHRVWDLYQPVLATGAFRSILTIGDYEVFERVR